MSLGRFLKGAAWTALAATITVPAAAQDHPWLERARGQQAQQQQRQQDQRAQRDNRRDDRSNRQSQQNDRGRDNTWRDNDNRRNDNRGRDNNWRGDNDRRDGTLRRDDGRNNTWRGDNDRRDGSLRRDNNWGGGDSRWRDNDRRGGGWSGNDRRDYNRWDRRWRDNNRYDWQRYRSSNRLTFRLGTYYSPYRNYSYRRFGIGNFLDSLFYGSSYWIRDPWQYRLPEVYGPYRWVRYYDDVLLVDIYSGEVVDVIYNFFW